MFLSRHSNCKWSRGGRVRDGNVATALTRLATLMLPAANTVTVSSVVGREVGEQGSFITNSKDPHSLVYFLLVFFFLKKKKDISQLFICLANLIYIPGSLWVNLTCTQSKFALRAAPLTAASVAPWLQCGDASASIKTHPCTHTLATPTSPLAPPLRTLHHHRGLRLESRLSQHAPLLSSLPATPSGHNQSFYLLRAWTCLRAQSLEKWPCVVKCPAAGFGKHTHTHSRGLCTVCESVCVCVLQ